MPMNQAFQAVVFDLDGTLLNTLADIARAMNTALAERGLPTHEVDAYRLMVGSGLEEVVRRAVPSQMRTDERTVADLAARLRERYALHPVELTRPYDGVLEMIAELRSRESLPLAILSNKADDLVREIVARFFGPDDFVEVRGLEDGVPAKPDPTSAIDVAARIGVSPAAVIYLGVSDIDVQTAKNAGMYALGAGWGFRGVDELRAAGSDEVIAHPLDLPDLLDRGK